MSWLVDALNWLLLSLGDVVQWLWNDGLGYLGSFFAFIDQIINPIFAPLLRALNIVVNAVARVLLAPIDMLPGWLSNTIISAVTGILLLIIFKYTSNQKAIGKVKDRIKANLLALKLFKDELSVTFRSQGRVFLGALRLMRYAIWPLLIMLVPVSLELSQMGLWYQYRPLKSGETALVGMKLADSTEEGAPTVKMLSNPGAEVLIGPVYIRSKGEVYWEIRAGEKGRHRLVFELPRQQIEKELVVGEGLMRVSAVRPAWDWIAILTHPLEKPLAKDSPVQSISVDYPARYSWTSGTDYWMVYFFCASLVFALFFKPFVKVKI